MALEIPVGGKKIINEVGPRFNEKMPTLVPPGMKTTPEADCPKGLGPNGNSISKADPENWMTNGRLVAMTQAGAE